MINTVHIKQQQFNVFRVGNQSGEVILIMGSCRGVPYLNYIDYYNKTIGGNKYLIYYIDPFNYNWNERDELVGCEAKLLELESDQSMLSILRSVKIFIHEHYESFGMFNTRKDLEKNIYQYMNPYMDICIPNFHDVFILENDFINVAKITDTEQMKDKALKEIERFKKICSLSSFPEMAEYFENNWRTTRLFCSFNHVSKQFTLKIFEWMNNKFLNLPLTQDFWNEISKQELYENTQTTPKTNDINNYGLTWR